MFPHTEQDGQPAAASEIPGMVTLTDSGEAARLAAVVTLAAGFIAAGTTEPKAVTKKALAVLDEIETALAVRKPL